MISKEKQNPDLQKDILQSADKKKTKNEGQSSTNIQNKQHLSHNKSTNKNPSSHLSCSPAMNRTSASISSPATNRISKGRNKPSPSRQRQNKMSAEDCERILRQKIEEKKYLEAAECIKSSKYLSEKYQLIDLIRLTLNSKKFDTAGALIREYGLQENQLLVAFFIKELVKSGQFNLAVRYAQELIENFGKVVSSSSTLNRPSWTPQALIQAMLRAKQYELALKHVKQFDLHAVFPPLQIVTEMVNMGEWSLSFKHVIAYELQNRIPLRMLIEKMIEAKEWESVIKSVYSAGVELKKDFSTEVLFERMLASKDFLPALKFARERSLIPRTPLSNSDEIPKPLFHLIDAMIQAKEFYKAIKYAIKFGLTNFEVFSVHKLIHQAIEAHYFHIASYYIKKLKLSADFQNELLLMDREKVILLKKFNQFKEYRTKEYNNPILVSMRNLLLGNADEYIDQVHTSVEVISVDEDIYESIDKLVDGEDEWEGEVILLKSPVVPKEENASFDFASFPAHVESSSSFLDEGSQYYLNTQYIPPQHLPTKSCPSPIAHQCPNPTSFVQPNINSKYLTPSQIDSFFVNALQPAQPPPPKSVPSLLPNFNGVSTAISPHLNMTSYVTPPPKKFQYSSLKPSNLAGSIPNAHISNR